MALIRVLQKIVAARPASTGRGAVRWFGLPVDYVDAGVAQFGGGGGGGWQHDRRGATAGVAVDADGVLKRVSVQDPTGDLARQRVQEALTRLDQNVAQRSKLRKVSLTRLERAIAAAARRRRGRSMT